MIEKVKYNEFGYIQATIDDVEFTIPDDLENLHRQMIAEWEKEEGNEIEPYIPPEPEPTVTIIPSVRLWERMTNAEAEQVNQVMQTQPFRVRKIFETAATFRSDHELWPLLEEIATELFGEERAGELLTGE